MRRGPPHFPVEAEHRDIVNRVQKIFGFDHIVLLVAAQAMLRSKRGGQVDIIKCRQGIQAVHQFVRHRSGMGKQSNPLARQRPTQVGIFDQTVYSKFHERFAASIVSPKQSR